MYSLYFDGASRGNPGIASFGGVIYKHTDNLKEEWLTYNYKFPEKATNNEAEYSGLYYGLLIAVEKDLKHLLVYGDSLLVINQIKGIWKIKCAHLKPIYTNIRRLLQHFDVIEFHHVKRKFNGRADALANEAIDG